MEKRSIPEGLPHSALLRELVKKTEALGSVPSRTPAYLEWLKALRDRIAPELSYANVTFPFFTPHDESNHIHPLFILTERLLGSDVLESLNAAELFVLASSIYAHDWGMAVSEAEKKCILGLIDPSTADSFSLLNDDRSAFGKIIKENRIEKPRTLEDVPLKVWQAYIRNTHAARSARRVRAFFQAIDVNLGEAVALVSEGHNHDLELIRSFESALPLQGESANIRALALYLRLTDLFDLAQDRTPYALWKFISPEDAKSALEWDKHRALSPAVIEPFHKTARCIKVHGATEDLSVYAALEDLREHCDRQLRLSNGLLNELDDRYHLRLLYLEWKVEAKGFEPIIARFEFDRQAMIDILSDEIYQGDDHVFLRELLQNSIDAMRLRRALHESKGTGLAFDGAIKVKVEHQSEGRATVSWTDNGSGMNEFIVRDYLTTVGRSFYRSEDFQKLGVQMDPISRFGVGIMSCFIVTDSLEIVTRQDPQIESSAEALKIEVRSPNRYLRIQRCRPDALPQVGTTVKVFVGHFVQDREAKKTPAKLDVTGYLKEIAGFVEFPIYIEEDGKRTVILRPGAIARCPTTTDWEVFTLDCSFSWEDFFVPQDVPLVRDFFDEEKIIIRSSAKSPLFEGTISFPALKGDFDLRLYYDSPTKGGNAYMVMRRSEELTAFRVRGRHPSGLRSPEKPRSIDCSNLCRIYCDGVLVAGASSPDWARGGWDWPSTLRIVLNVRPSGKSKLDLSRHDMAVEEHDWRKILRQRYTDYFRRRMKRIIAEKSSPDALFQLVRLIASGFRDYKSLDKLISSIPIPLLVLEKSSGIAFVMSDSLLKDSVRVVPRFVTKDLAGKLFAGWTSNKWLDDRTVQIKWAGEPCIFADGMRFGGRLGSSFQYVEALHEAWLRASCDLSTVRFLSPGKKNYPPHMQEIWVPKRLCSHNGKKKDRLTVPVMAALKATAWFEGLGYEFSISRVPPKFVTFAEPFEKFFTAGWHYLNVRHPLVSALVECVSIIADGKSTGAIGQQHFGVIRDALRRLLWEDSPWDRYLFGREIEVKYEGVRQLFNLTSELGIFKFSIDPNWARGPINVPAVTEGGEIGAPIMSLREVGL